MKDFYKYFKNAPIYGQGNFNYVFLINKIIYKVPQFILNDEEENYNKIYFDPERQVRVWNEIYGGDEIAPAIYKGKFKHLATAKIEIFLKDNKQIKVATFPYVEGLQITSKNFNEEKFTKLQDELKKHGRICFDLDLNNNLKENNQQYLPIDVDFMQGILSRRNSEATKCLNNNMDILFKYPKKINSEESEEEEMTKLWKERK